jgi:DNA (cytosine-5)-methyltransferase 1
LQRLGFHVTGVDNVLQPRYCGDSFFQADALTFPLDGFDFIWASPPCQRFSSAQPLQSRHHEDFITPIRQRLIESGLPYIIENVPGAPLINPVTLCGLALGLNVKRHRLFESNMTLPETVCPKGHHGDWLIVFGFSALHRSKGAGTGPKKDRGKSKGKSVPHAEACMAMGIDWMKPTELSQAVPPQYVEFLFAPHPAKIS